MEKRNRYGNNGRCAYIKKDGRQCANIAQGWIGQWPGKTAYHCPLHKAAIIAAFTAAA